MATVNDAEEIDLHGPAPVLQGQLADEAAAADAGVVHDQIDGSDTLGCERLDVGDLGDVAPHRARVGGAGTLALGCRFLGGDEVDVGEHQGGAPLSQVQREGSAEAGPGAGDDTLGCVRKVQDTPRRAR